MKRPNWISLRNKIQKGKGFCLFCNNKNMRSNLSFATNQDVHHIDGNENNDEISNLTILCKACHKKLHVKIYKILKIKSIKYNLINPALPEESK